jgi:hypothetical protein
LQLALNLASESHPSTYYEGTFMKEVAILLLAALLLNGCGTSKPTAQTAAGGVWSAQMSGGDGSASGFSFVTQFTVASNGALSFSSFEFINQGTCFPLNGGTVSGSMTLTQNMATNQVTGSMTLTVASGGNTLTLTSSAVTGTLTGNTLSGGSAPGSWSLTGGTGCTDAAGSFTMTQTTG